VTRKHNRQQLVFASDSDSSAAVLQLAVPQRPASTVPATPGTLLRHEVYPPSCILPDISQVISQPAAAVQTCSSKASCGSAGAPHAAAGHVSSAMTAVGSDSRVQSMAMGRDIQVRLSAPCTVSSSDAGMSFNVNKAALFTPFTPACSPGACQTSGPSGVEESPDGSRETNALSYGSKAQVAAQCSGGAISSLQSQPEGGLGMQSAFVPSALHANRGTLRSRVQSQLPCQSSTLDAVQSAGLQESGDVSGRPRKLLASVRPATDADAMDCT